MLEILKKNRNGQALVETALILPFLLLLVFGIIEFGRALYITNTLNNAAREGARLGAVTVPWNETAIENKVTASIPFDKSGLTINVTSYNDPDSDPPRSGAGDPVIVKVYLPFTSVVSGIIPQLSGITLHGEATMRYEG